MKELSASESIQIRVNDMCTLAEERCLPVFSHFLNEREQYFAEKMLRARSGIQYLFWGGHESCARKMLCVCDEYSMPEKEEFPVYPLSFWFGYGHPEHKDLLGAFMSLGIKRETVGDIFVGEKAAAVFCTRTAHDVIYGGVDKVGRIGVHVNDGLSEIAAKIIKPVEMRTVDVCIASMRADCIVSALTKLSREKSAAFIRSGAFMLNYEECTNISRNISEGDILTLHRYGKFIVCSDVRETKKGKLRLDINKYI